MRTFWEDPALLVPGDLAYVNGAWDEIIRATPALDGWEDIYPVYVRLASDPESPLPLPMKKLVRVAR